MLAFPDEPIQPKCPYLIWECPQCSIPYADATTIDGDAIPVCPPFLDSGNVYQVFLIGVRVYRGRFWFRQNFLTTQEPTPIPASWSEPELRQTWYGQWYRTFYGIPTPTTPPFGPDYSMFTRYWTDKTLQIPPKFYKSIYRDQGDWSVVDIFDSRSPSQVYMDYANGGIVPYSLNMTVERVSDPYEISSGRWCIEYIMDYDEAYFHFWELQYIGPMGKSAGGITTNLAAVFVLMSLFTGYQCPSKRSPKLT